MLEGEPQDPRAIYYLKRPVDALPDLDAVPVEQWVVTALFTRSPNPDAPVQVEDPSAQSAGTVLSVVDIVDIEPSLLASTTPGQLLDLPKRLRAKVLKRWLGAGAPVVAQSAGHRLAQVHDHAAQIAKDVTFLSEMTPVGPDLYRCRTLGVDGREFLARIYLDSRDPSEVAHDIWIRTSDVPCVLIAVNSRLPISNLAKRLDSSAQESIEADITEIVVSQRLTLVAHALGSMADHPLADATELANRRLEQAAQAAADARAELELPHAVDAAFELAREALVAPQDTDELQQVSQGYKTHCASCPRPRTI